AHSGGLGGTYGGNPVACAGALGAIETMRELDLNARARRIEEVMKGRLEEMRAKLPNGGLIGDVRGRGAMIAIELVKPGTKDPDAAATAALAKACHAEGLLVLTCGTYGNVLRFLYPLTIPDAQFDRA
ncbi:MAG TPA: 4-aminobutyrate--2-oxoglutarate transaminase, partial [Streptomyces sp.]|nr:4-aminobutyrate--2-oxoglutarate transaminase [Streptomyces sp.]